MQGFQGIIFLNIHKISPHMKALLIAPVVALFLLGFTLQLQAIAEDTAAQTLTFADDMRLAIPCATRGIPVDKCSPHLSEVDFEPQVNTTIETLEYGEKQMSLLREQILQEQQLMHP